MKFPKRFALLGLFLLSVQGCAAGDDPVLARGEYGTFCGIGRPVVAGATPGAVLDAMAPLRARDDLDDACREHDFCVVRERNVASVRCSLAMQRTLEAADRERRWTSRCRNAAFYITTLFRLRDNVPIQIADPRGMDAVTEWTTILQQGTDTLFWLLPSAGLALNGTPDAYEPCFLFDGRPSPPSVRDIPEHNASVAEARGPSHAVPTGTGVLAIRAPSNAWTATAEDGNTLRLMGRGPGDGGETWVRVRPVPLAREASLTNLASLIAHRARTTMGLDGEAILLDEASLGGRRSVRYHLSGRVRGQEVDHLIYVVPMGSAGGPIAALVWGTFAPRDRAAGIRHTASVAASLRSGPASRVRP